MKSGCSYVPPRVQDPRQHIVCGSVRAGLNEIPDDRAAQPWNKRRKYCAASPLTR